MIQKRIAHYFFIAVLVLLLYVSFLILKPYMTYMLLALVLAYSFYPTYQKVQKILKNPNLSASFMVIFIIILIVLPVIFVITSIVEQTGSVYNNYNPELINRFNEGVNERFGTQLDLPAQFSSMFESGVSFVLKNSLNLVSGATEVFIGLFIMFVAMFYLFKKGHKTQDIVMQYLPLKNQYKEDLIKEVKNVTHAVVYSQVLVSLVQGLLLGISFLIFGLPNPIFWGFIGVILSFLPVVGAPLIWIPAGAINLLSGNVGVGIGVLLFNGLITMNIDNVMRPRLVSGKSRLPTFMTLIGIIGGLKLFGFIGMLLGPMVLALFVVLLKYFNKEF